MNEEINDKLIKEEQNDNIKNQSIDELFNLIDEICCLSIIKFYIFIKNNKLVKYYLIFVFLFSSENFRNLSIDQTSHFYYAIIYQKIFFLVFWLFNTH